MTIEPSCSAAIRAPLAIVATVVDSYESLSDWFFYHQQVGFERFYLFLDDGDERTYQLASQIEGVRCFKVDEVVRQAWSLLPESKSCFNRLLLDREVMARQEFNVRLAALLAQADGCGWLLHIDGDELFYPNGQDVRQHFASLDRDGVGSMVYFNYEAIPTQGDHHRPFESITLFKKNFFRRKHWVFNQEQRAFLNSSPVLSPKFFNFYQNGKCAVSVKDDINVVGVHEMRRLGRELKLGSEGDPTVLHYPCATYKDFVNKYRRLGQFGDLWKGEKRAGRFIDTFHLEARDALLYSDEAEAKKLYFRRMVLGEETIARLFDLDLVRSVDFVRNLLSRGRTPAFNSAIEGRGHPVIGECKHFVRTVRSMQTLADGEPKPDRLPPKDVVHINLAEFLGQWLADEQLTFATRASALSWIRANKLRLQVELGYIKLASGRYAIDPPVWDLQRSSIKERAAIKLQDACQGFTTLAFSGAASLSVEQVEKLSVSELGLRRTAWISALMDRVSSAPSTLLLLDGVASKWCVPEFMAGRVHGVVLSRIPQLVQEAIATRATGGLCEYILDGDLLADGAPKYGRLDEVLPAGMPDDRFLRKCILALLSLLNIGWLMDQVEEHRMSEDLEYLRLLWSMQGRIREGLTTPSRLLLPELDGVIIIRSDSPDIDFLAISNLRSEDITLSETLIHRYRLNGSWCEMFSGAEVLLEHHLTVRAARFLWLVKKRN